MKAKVKKDGRIIEVEKAMIGYAECDVANIGGFPAQNFYSEKDLEFLPDTPEEVTIEGWVCRDGCEDIRDSILRLFLKGEPFPDYIPERLGMNSIQMWKGANGLHLPSEMFPEVTWQSEPKRVKITITPME